LNRELKTFSFGFLHDALNKKAAVAGAAGERAMGVKTTRITIETESLLVVHRAKTIVARCPVCCADVEAMTLADDGRGEDIPSALLREWLASGKLHVWSSEGGPAQVCLTSLMQCFKSEDVRKPSDPNRTFPKTGDGK
jgi:hypothetical protein